MYFFRRLISKIAQSYIVWKTAKMVPIGKILMFHKIGDDEGEFNISIIDFYEFMTWLKRKNVINLCNWENENDFYAITIDDVPESFYKNAFPILKELELPFTLFVSTSLLDKDGYITTDQLTEMLSCPFCTIGSHGDNHGYFYKMSSDKALEDLKTSKNFLENITGKSVDIYAFPYGSYFACGFKNKHLVTEVYKYGFGTIPIAVTKNNGLPYYFLPRINVDTTYIRNIR